MWLSELEADRLRNLNAVRVSLPQGLTVVAGRNGHGKTSLLEAAYLLATGRSFRSRKLQDLTAWAGGPLRVAGRIATRRGDTRLAVIVDEGSRRLSADGVEREIRAYLGRLAVVDLTAERMNVVRGAPPERRRFLDRGIVGLTSEYLKSLGEYRRALMQRNTVLRRARGRSRSESDLELRTWEERLAAAGATLHRRRRRYALELSVKIQEIAADLLPDAPELRIRYKPSPHAAEEADPARFEELFREALDRGRARDLDLGHTCRGPHRDDLVVELGGVDLRRFGSAGQVRGAMVALKLAKLSLLREENGDSPLFLMDDFDTDLDEVRAATLASFLVRGGFQALVATSKEGLVDRLGVDFLRVRMDEGSARTA